MDSSSPMPCTFTVICVPPIPHLLTFSFCIVTPGISSAFNCAINPSASGSSSNNAAVNISPAAPMPQSKYKVFILIIMPPFLTCGFVTVRHKPSFLLRHMVDHPGQISGAKAIVDIDHRHPAGAGIQHRQKSAHPMKEAP